MAFSIKPLIYELHNLLHLKHFLKLKFQDGERFPRRGYWGDMLVSPYITFGVETEEKSFYKKHNNNHIKVCTFF